jgi:hypothetical protein
MRGSTTRQVPMLSKLTPEQLVPLDDPLRRTKVIVERALGELSSIFDAIHAADRRAQPPARAPARGLLC